MKFKNLACVFMLLATTQINAKPIFSPYVDISRMQASELIAASKATGLKQLRLAFIVDGGKCKPIWYSRPDHTIASKWAVEYNHALQANSISTVISFGGADGSVLSDNCNQTELVTVLEKIIKTYQPASLDFDVEVKTKDVSTLLSSLEVIQKNHPDLPIIFTLPTKPDGLKPLARKIVQDAHDHHLKFIVNIMTMDYGKDYSRDMAQYAISAAQQLFIFLKSLYPDYSDQAIWQMIELTPMIGMNDTPSEKFTLENAKTLRSFAREKNIHALSMWSLGRDKPCDDKVASPVCSGDRMQKKPLEFVNVFLR